MGASPASGQAAKSRIYLEFSRDEDVEHIPESNEFEKRKNRERSIIIGNCRLLDVKLEKAGNYEINPPAVSTRFYSLIIFLER